MIKNPRKLYIVLICIAVASIGLKIVADGRFITGQTDEVSVSAADAYSFLNLAFSNKIWNEEGSSKIFKDRLAVYLSQRSDGVSDVSKPDEWALPFLDPSRQLPDNGTIHKWEEEDITIGLGMPFDMDYVSSEEVKKSYALIQEQVNSLIPILEKQTQRRIRLIAPRDEVKAAGKYGHIRIIPMENIGEANGYPGFSGPPLLSYESDLWGAELFHGADPTKLRGFLIPNSDNSLAFSICKIKMGVAPETIKESADECLIRAMGLPGEAESVGESNRAFLRDDYIKMLPLLYDQKIKSGMSKNKVLRVFSVYDL